MTRSASRLSTALALAACISVSLAPAPAPAPAPAVSLAAGAAAAQAAGCGAEQHRQFDFWIGDWEVFDPSGQRVGSNRIDSVLGGCALHESWRGASGSRGSSYNFYDRATGHWHQTWIDANGGALYLNGELRGGEMVLSSEDGSQRITWTPLPSGHVRQHWQQSTDGGESWSTSFDGEYRRVY